MTTRQIVLNVPEKILLAEKTDEAAFHLVGLPNWPVCRE
jgi:hypothetical protein